MINLNRRTPPGLIRFADRVYQLNSTYFPFCFFCPFTDFPQYCTFSTLRCQQVNNYRAPEARTPDCRPTQKWDVYSFGVVLLELLTGKPPELSPTTSSASASTSTEIPDLVRWVRKVFEEERPLLDMVDPALMQEVHVKKEVLAAFHTALACTEGDPNVRPKMKSVSESLDKVGA